jgi:ribose 5-phosphate isomerase A
MANLSPQLPNYKRQAAERALAYIQPGMKVGLGTGSTAEQFVELLAERVRTAGLDCVCVPTSLATENQARRLGLRLTTLDDEPFLDIVVDGTDEIDGRLQLIKGGGAALLREKIVATASDRMIVIADASKKVAMLGAFPLPVELVRFGMKSTAKMVAMMVSDAGCSGDMAIRLGRDGQPLLTDGGNVILDMHLKRIEQPEMLAESLRLIPGVVEHGLFLGLADTAILAGPNGIEVLEANYDED